MKKIYIIMASLLLLFTNQAVSAMPAQTEEITLNAPVITSAKVQATRKVNVTFKKVEHATSYQLYAKTGNEEFQLLHTVNADTTTITTKALKEKTTYQFMMKSIYKNGENEVISEASATKKVTTPKQYIVVLDAGHQGRGNSSLEQAGPKTKTKKAKVASGTSGVATKVPEYKLTLTMAKKVQTELTKRGYKVIMCRTSNNVNISNKERALIANKYKADAFIRIHANGSVNRSVNGAQTICPVKSSVADPSIIAPSQKLSTALLNEFVKATNARKEAVYHRGDLSGSNWSKVPVTVLEMGYMSNAKEDRLMQTAAYQKKMTTGICNGIDSYFKVK